MAFAHPEYEDVTSPKSTQTNSVIPYYWFETRDPSRLANSPRPFCVVGEPLQIFPVVLE